LYRLEPRLQTVTLISGMGPIQLQGALRGMDFRRHLFLRAGSRSPRLARRALELAGEQFRADPHRLLDRLIATWALPDRVLFQRRNVYDLFLRDLHQVFTEGSGALGLAQELAIYRNFSYALAELSAKRRVTIWHGLDDIIVPPSMAWKLVQ